MQVLNLPGFLDDDSTIIGKVKNTPSKIDHSKMTLNEFITLHYFLGESMPLFRAVMGLYLGKRLFILPSKLSSAGSRLLEMLHLDILRFMTAEAGESMLEFYHRKKSKNHESLENFSTEASRQS
jgi:hypothetical protein